MTHRQETRTREPITVIANKLPKGSYAIALIQKSAYHLHTGVQHYSRYFIVRVTSASRDGIAKEFTDHILGIPKRVDRYTTIYSFPSAYAEKAQDAYEAQMGDFTGFVSKSELKDFLVRLGTY